MGKIIWHKTSSCSVNEIEVDQKGSASFFFLCARRFDGNISETAFSHRVVPASGSPGLQANTWSYAYDGMKRLTGANHYPGTAQTPSLTDTEREIADDRNGNITHLKRYGSAGLENDLAFTHTGNRMTSLSDANATGSASGSKSFTYDANGNLISGVVRAWKCGMCLTCWTMRECTERHKKGRNRFRP